MAITDPTAAVTETAACTTGRCGSCRGVVFSITDAHLTDCQHGCHNRVADLPDTWKERAVLTPPCDGDLDLAPVDPEQELEDLLDREADAHLWDWSL